MNPTPDAVCQEALAWVGRDFNPGVSAQCAAFVRSVFKAQGYTLPEAARPDDLAINPGMPLSAAYADSLAGDEIGPRVPRDQVRAGDLVLFADTYDSGYARGTITHVGVALNNTEMVDRSTSSHPVLRRAIDTFTGSAGSFAEARRPQKFLAPAPAPAEVGVRLQLWAHVGSPEGLGTLRIPKALAAGDYSVLAIQGDPQGAAVIQVKPAAG